MRSYIVLKKSNFDPRCHVKQPPLSLRLFDYEVVIEDKRGYQNKNFGGKSSKPKQEILNTVADLPSMSLEVTGNEKDEEDFTTTLHTEVACEGTSDVCLVSSDLTKKDGRPSVVSDNGENVFNEIETNTLSMGPTMVEEVNNQKFVQQNVVTIDANSLVDYSANAGILNNIEIINNNVNTDTNPQPNSNNGTIYLLVSQSDTQTILQPIDQQQISIQQPANVAAPPQMLNIVNLDQSTVVTNSDNLKTVNIQNVDSLSSCPPEGAVVQVMNTEGVPVNINVNDIIASLGKNNLVKKDGNAVINLASFVTSNPLENTGEIKTTEGGQYILNTNSDLVNTIPNWALQLRDCTLCGDTYTGYVLTESEMDDILNLYKKETQSLFAIRQTPSTAKDESSETVRLMWKSQYIPYDGIPFVNVGRRATVMECEHGPRKRSNALKRMAAMSGQKSKKIPNLTCPARLFVKKVKKFPQYRVPPEADPKVVRGMQEHALKMVRSNGVASGEIRLYMQLPLPSAHRYHHIGNSLEAFQKELANLDNVLMESISVDNRILEQLQTYVRQGFNNPFQVRAGLKDFVQNRMKIGLNDALPSKHDKAFYPSLIEIQNMIQQTEAAIETGVLTKLPTPDEPPIPLRPKRKRTKTVESPSSSLNTSSNNGSPSTSTTTSSSLVIKRMKIDVPTNQNPDLLSVDLKKELKRPLDGTLELDDQNDTIALTLTDNQLENFSVTNFSYDQLAQLAKIGLAALNNASKEPDGPSQQEQNIDNTVEHVEVHLADKDDPTSLATTDGESILIVTPSDVNEDKTHLRIIATSENADQPITDPSAILANVVDIVDGT